MGVFLFAYMMGNINSLVEKLDDDHDEYVENEIEQLEEWLMRIDSANPKKHLTREIVHKIKDSLTTFWKLDHTIVNNENFLNQLPIDVRKE